MGGAHTILNVALRKEGQLLGMIAIYRQEVRPFSDKEIALLQSFAAQAVIAMENARLLGELRESLDQQTATSEILRVIAQSPTDVAPVLEAVSEAALRFCGAEDVAIDLREGEIWRCVAHAGILKSPVGMTNAVGRKDLPGRTMLDRAVTQIPDIEATTGPETEFDRGVGRQVGFRAALAAPLLRQDEAAGAIILHRTTPGAFSDRQIALLESFAAQAVIALENTRLFTELRESLDQQTATSEILRVISQSPTDVGPVLTAVAKAALRFCGAEDVGIFLREDEQYLMAAHEGPMVPEVGVRYPLSRQTAPGQAMLDSRTAHFPDIGDLDTVQYAAAREFSLRHGFKAAIAAPMLREGTAVGAVTLRRSQAGAFTPHQIELLESFAAQAVIALENTRLFTELQKRTDDLSQSLEYQTAIGEVLTVISRSTFDLAPVLQTLAETAMRLCESEMAYVARREGDVYRVVTAAGATPESARDATDYQHYQEAFPIAPGRGSVTGRVALEGRPVQIADITTDPEYTLAGASALGKIRTQIGVPLMREGSMVGVIILSRQRVEPFTDRQITLLRTFADQAVIAMENARLLGELRERTDDLTQSLEYQTATSEVLEVISRSTSDLQPVLDTMLAAAVRLCSVHSGCIAVRHGDAYRHMASVGFTPEFDKALRSREFRPGRGSVSERVLLDKKVCHVIDVQADADFTFAEAVTLDSTRTVLGVPLIREDDTIGVIALIRTHVEPFTDRQIALVKTFADQAVIAMENARLLSELRESLDQQTAMAEVLGLINGSTGDITPVFDAMVDKAMALCDASYGVLFSYDGQFLRGVSTRRSPQDTEGFLLGPIPVGPTGTIGRALREGRAAQNLDLSQSDAYERRVPLTVYSVERIGIRTVLFVPLISERGAVGLFGIYRLEVKPFTDNQIALVEAFAQQAVVAMENARLLGELTRREEELRVTFDNMGDGVVMFDADQRLASWNRNFQELLDIPDDFLAGRPGLEDYVRLLVQRGELGDRDPDKEVARYRDRAARQWSAERTRPDGRVLEVRNNPVPGGGGVLIYSDVTKRKQAEAEIRAARDAAEEALERQTATADILEVIANSPTDVAPVLRAVVKAAIRFCGAEDATVILRDGDQMHFADHEGPLPSSVGQRRAMDRTRIAARVMEDAETIHLPDIRQADRAEFAPTIDLNEGYGIRALLGAPMMREEVGIGCLLLRRAAPGSFTADQIRLLETFAAQAVIAIENVRLFTELRESLEQQTATSEILRAISQSPTDVAPVLTAVVQAAIRFCGATDAMIQLRDGDSVIARAHEGPLTYSAGARRQLDRSTAGGRAIVDAMTCHLPDIEALDPVEFATGRKLAAAHGFRAIVAAPLKRDDTAIGCVLLRKIEAGAFTPQQIALLETFAAQAVIAIENVRLFTELRDSLERLKAAQANLVQSEKMASLGQLTAGIAHEIKNPLNFVNNFATLSVDLLDELREVAGPALATLDEDKRAELDETMQLLVGNLGKIAEHGKRADGIVKSMLSHSRGGTGDWAPSDINALVEEALNLAYHGARAQDKEFNVTLERDFEKESKPIELVPQDVTRVFLNLFGNGFYAANKRRLASKAAGGKDAGFRPTLTVSTRETGDGVEVKVRDNGIGMSAEVKEKLFQPFFTTKPTGEGTGLGLSISYDIVTQQHGGTIGVESELGQFTEFTVRLPRARRTTEARGS